MKLRLRSMAAAAAVAALALGGISVATAGTAGAQTLGHPKKHKPKPKPVPQIVGKRLLTGLLKPGAFGDEFGTFYTAQTGNSLWPSKARYSVASMSCANFEDYSFIPRFGETALAQEGFYNPSPYASYPNDVVEGIQDVSQFATAKAASTFYNQSLAKYKACGSFSEPNPGDDNPGGGSFDVANMSLRTTKVAKNQGFVTIQQVAFSEAQGISFYGNTLTVLAGTNVYQFYEVSGTNDEPSPTLMNQLIGQVQKLYPRH